MRKKLNTKEGMLPASVQAHSSIYTVSGNRSEHFSQISDRAVDCERSTRESVGVLEISILSSSGWWVHGVYKYKKIRYIHMIYALYYMQIILHFERENYLQT